MLSRILWKLRCFILKGCLLLGFFVKKSASPQSVRYFIQNFNKHYVSCDLVRIGRDGDGGYLVPNILHLVRHCFSPGVDDSISFEKDLSENYGIVSFLIDGSIDGVDSSDPRIIFSKKFLGCKTQGNYIRLKDWVTSSIPDGSDPLILQMDIEGGEYEVLSREEMQLLKRFGIIVFEIHNLDSIFETNFLRSINGTFERIFDEFSVCHAHPNNGCGLVSVQGIAIPKVMEITLIRNDLIVHCKSDAPVKLPHSLDKCNVKGVSDPPLAHIWWKKDINSLD